MVGTTTRVYGEPEVACLTSYNLETEARRITSGISDNFVSAPSHSQTLDDLLVGLKRFRNSIRWKWIFLEQKRVRRENSAHFSTDTQEYFHTTTIPVTPVEPTNTPDPNEKSENPIPTIIPIEKRKTIKTHSKVGLGTGIRPKNKINQAPPVSIEIEVFLKEVERSLLGNFKPKIELQGAKRLINGDIKTLKTNLMNNENTVIVPTDKTSSYRTVPTTTYCNRVNVI